MTTRKGFIVATAALAATPQIASAASPSPRPAPSQAPIPKLNFDLAAFDALLDREIAHKHLFADRKIDGGSGLDAVRSTLNAYRDIGVAVADVATAMVLYHGPSISIAMDDYVWDTYLIPGQPAIKKASPEMSADFSSVLTPKTKGNPLLKPKPNDYDASVQALSADGLRFFVCNNALRGFAEAVAKSLNVHATDVYADLAKHFVPNTTIVPAGVWAIHYSQQKRYTLLQT